MFDVLITIATGLFFTKYWSKWRYGYFDLFCAGAAIVDAFLLPALVEKFVTVQIEKGNKTAIVLAFETLVISIVGYYIASWDVLITILAAQPWLVLVTIPINIFLGKYTGLRFTEYYRFKEVIKKID